MENCSSLMGAIIQVTLRMIGQKVMAVFIIPMEITIKDSSKITLLMDMESIMLPLEESIKDNGRRIKDMGTGRRLGLMALSSRGSFRKIRNLVMENSSISTEIPSQDK